MKKWYVATCCDCTFLYVEKLQKTKMRYANDPSNVFISDLKFQSRLDKEFAAENKRQFFVFKSIDFIKSSDDKLYLEILYWWEKRGRL